MIDLPHTKELIERIYLCALGQSSWLDFMLAFQKCLPGAGSNFLITTDNSMVGSISLNTGFSEGEIERFNRHYAFTNPWIPMVAEAPAGLGINTDTLLDRNILRRTEYYNDFMQPLDLKGAVGVIVSREQGRSFLFNTMTASEDFETKQSAADLLTTLSPHLKRSFDYVHHGSADDSRTLLSAIGVGVIMVSADQRVHSINARAEDMIEKGCAVAIGPTGRCRFLAPSLRDIAREMIRSTERDSRPAAMVHRSQTLPDGLRYTLVRMSSQPIADYLGGPKLAILIEQIPLESVVQRLEALSMAHNLTKAEMEVAQCIAKGASIKAAAGIRGVSGETIRSQLKSVYSKLNIAGKTELMRMLL